MPVVTAEDGTPFFYEDWTVLFDISRKRTAAAIPNAKLLVYEDEPHAVPFTHADRPTGDLLEFLAGGA